MTQELKDKWIAALRSGEFKQGRGRLCVAEGGVCTHCCLGVLNVVGALGVPEEGYSLSLVSDIIGLSVTDQDTLIGLNDEARWGFPKIADWIEENVEVTP